MENLKIGDRFDMYESLPSEYQNVYFKAGTQRITNDFNRGFGKFFICFDIFGKKTNCMMFNEEIKKIGTWIVKRLPNTDPCTII